MKEFGPSSCTTPRRALLELVEISMLKTRWECKHANLELHAWFSECGTCCWCQIRLLRYMTYHGTFDLCDCGFEFELRET